MNNQYTEKSCQHAWEQICSPTIHLPSKWSPEEDELLESLVQIHGPYADQWSSIASHFVKTNLFFDISTRNLSILVSSFPVYVRTSLYVLDKFSFR